jgi:hypothetical protein
MKIWEGIIIWNNTNEKAIPEPLNFSLPNAYPAMEDVTTAHTMRKKNHQNGVLVQQKEIHGVQNFLICVRAPRFWENYEGIDLC